MIIYEAIIVPDNPMLPSPYPPVVLLESETLDQIKQWFKEAQEQGGYQGCHLHTVRPIGKAGEVG